MLGFCSSSYPEELLLIMKRRPNLNGGFFSALLINLIFNLEWTIPAWLLLGAHYFFRISIFWFVGALILWVLGVSVKTIVFSWLVRNGNIPDPPKENKNPYSSTYKPGKKGENKDENI